ncbi:uncharacterized protein BJ212DRAFT_1348270 [Suillus subaureus]|uniref:Uncharacterized protein n=1 Tax=Suillus subaureus TaxID=48587 RepID=A0A9P7EDJ9_9AGAM|nr:uncharacterized protein BJ212DRAFT_1348270 [Suillus subaureus]KAG1818012.1 hypothetical protein BJ212DRAFT_1348270 [Suillus subaureus]
MTKGLSRLSAIMWVCPSVESSHHLIELAIHKLQARWHLLLVNPTADQKENAKNAPDGCCDGSFTERFWPTKTLDAWEQLRGILISSSTC